MTVPPADLSDLPVPLIDVEDPKAAQAIREACTQHGFFYGQYQLKQSQTSWRVAKSI